MINKLGVAENVQEKIELGDTHQAVKTVMRLTGDGERTTKNWFAGTTDPIGERPLSLVRHFNAVLDASLQLAGVNACWQRSASLTLAPSLSRR